MFVLGMVLRIEAARDELWIDELISSWTVSGTLSDVAGRAEMGNCGPLYFWGLWLAKCCFGLGPWTLRLPSLVAGGVLLISIVLVVLQGTRSLLAATCAGLAAAIDQNFVFYGSEARVYALVQLLGVAQVIGFTIWLVRAASGGAVPA